jgi:hypothetical protein
MLDKITIEKAVACSAWRVMADGQEVLRKGRFDDAYAEGNRLARKLNVPCEVVRKRKSKGADSLPVNFKKGKAQKSVPWQVLQRAE